MFILGCQRLTNVSGLKCYHNYYKPFLVINFLQFSPPDLSAPGTIYYLGPPAEKFRAGFNTLFSQVAQVLGADNTTAHIEADRVWLFEQRLAKVSMLQPLDVVHWEQEC